jgi:uroporphyrin-III C-methyltransferase
MSDEIEGKVLEEKEVDAVVTQDEVATNNNATSKTCYILLLLFVLLFSGAFVYGYKRIVTLEHKLTETSSIEARVLADVDDRIKASTAASSVVDSEHRKKLDELETGQEVLTNIVNQPAEQQIHINEDYALAEVEHLLIIASYNLQLDHDATTALAAMEAADARLKGLRDPLVLSVREQLIAEMNELRSINQADLSGLGLFLSDLINRVDQLPLKGNVVVEKQEVTVEPGNEQLGGVKHFFVLVWEELKSLVVITRDTEINKARLLPDEIYYLRANLKLELANARFAVFNRDTDNLHASIGHIQVWLNEYFDLSDAATQNIHDSLLRMKDLELEFPRMDISSSLESVRALIRSQEETSNSINDAGIEPGQ